MLNGLRKKIDKIDSKLSKLLIKRYDLVKEIFIFKNKNSLPIEDKKREKEMIKRLLSTPELTNSEKKYIKKIFLAVHDASKGIQK